MDKPKVKVEALSLNKEIATKTAIFLGLLALVTVVPFFVHNQLITGPMVNAVLFIATAVVGIPGAVLIALVPSVVALSGGLLPAVLAPAVPFIMIGNVILILTFHYAKKKNFWLGMIGGSVLKYLFLFGSTSLVVSLLLKSEMAEKASLMLSWPQLATALVGGIIAWGVLKVWKKV